MRPYRGPILSAFAVALILAFPAGWAAAASPAGGPRLVIVFCLDGLRPDNINPTDTPTIHRLREEGVFFENSHAVFPTSTNANAAALSTGAYPGTNGILNNSLYFATSTAPEGVNYRNLKRLEALTGRMLLVESLAERLDRIGQRFVVVSSGGQGQTIVLNPFADRGVGVSINTAFNGIPGIPNRVAFPDFVDAAIKARFPPAPPFGPVVPRNAYVDWHQQIILDYVLPELAPDVLLNWLTEPDGSHHDKGVGSPEAISAIRNDDRNVGLVLQKVADLGLLDETDVFLVSDHGFSANTVGINVEQELVDAGLKEALVSGDVVRVSRSLYVKDRNPDKIRRIVEYLQRQEWVGAVLTAPRSAAAAPGRSGEAPAAPSEGRGPEDVQGWVEGTFSLDLIHMWEPDRGPDITFAFPWSNERNPFGYPGLEYTEVTDRTQSGPVAWTNGVISNHGGLSPWNIRNTMIAWGADFKRGVSIRTPSSNVDVVRTILALKGMAQDSSLDGRVLAEALVDGPHETVPAKTRVFTTGTSDGRYRAMIQVSEVGSQRYVDKGWRVPAR